MNTTPAPVVSSNWAPADAPTAINGQVVWVYFTVPNIGIFPAFPPPPGYQVLIAQQFSTVTNQWWAALIQFGAAIPAAAVWTAFDSQTTVAGAPVALSYCGANVPFAPAAGAKEILPPVQVAGTWFVLEQVAGTAATTPTGTTPTGTTPTGTTPTGTTPTGTTPTGTTPAGTTPTGTTPTGTTPTGTPGGGTRMFGVNLEEMIPWGRSRPFIDLVKTSPGFDTLAHPGDHAAPVGADGWPISDFGVILVQGAPVTLSGVYTIIFQGQATLTCSNGSKIANSVYNAATNTTTATLTWNAAIDSLSVFCAKTTAPRHIQVLRPGYTQAQAAAQPFSNEFLKLLTTINPGIIRAMDALETNNTKVVNWADRSTSATPSYNTTARPKAPGMPYEYLVQLCNTINCDLWLNVPVTASDDYRAQLAALVAQQLKPGLFVYLEYGNEVWNSDLGSNAPNMAAAAAQAAAMGFDSRLAADRQRVRPARAGLPGRHARARAAGVGWPRRRPWDVPKRLGVSHRSLSRAGVTHLRHGHRAVFAIDAGPRIERLAGAPAVRPARRGVCHAVPGFWGCLMLLRMRLGPRY
jgi:hypothetical protein